MCANRDTPTPCRRKDNVSLLINKESVFFCSTLRELDTAQPVPIQCFGRNNKQPDWTSLHLASKGKPQHLASAAPHQLAAQLQGWRRGQETFPPARTTQANTCCTKTNETSQKMHKGPDLPPPSAPFPGTLLRSHQPLMLLAILKLL